MPISRLEKVKIFSPDADEWSLVFYNREIVQSIPEPVQEAEWLGVGTPDEGPILPYGTRVPAAA